MADARHHLSALDAVGRIAASFGPRTGNFPLITEYALGDGFRIDDRGLWCCNGPNLVADSASFLGGTGTHRASPWFRVPLHLNSIAEAQER